MKKVFYCIVAFWLLPQIAFATHIVGGDMTYRFMERQGDNNRYAFTLKIYYDCYPADGHIAIDSDSTITIAVYQQMTVSPELWRLVGNNNSSRMLLVRRQPVITIPNPTFECIVPPPNICVYEGIFEFELILKRLPMPYCITYQRCCRNQSSIANLPTNSQNMGSNYHVFLSPEAQQANNSTPKFNNYPNTTICLGESLIYDHSAFESEGDSLSYRFSQPLTSPGMAGRPGCYASPAATPVGNYNCPPPLQYAASFPQYPFTQPMAGNPVVAIDPVTGMIRGKPYSLGQFVVAVCVEEWRAGVLLGKVYREFQFNVVNCPKKVDIALNQADSVRRVGDKEFIIAKCDSTTITIVNHSKQLRYVNQFYWEFNIGGVLRRFTDWHPTIAFPDTGYYRGVLWINKGERCYDSAYVNVLIGSGIKNTFGMTFDSCKAGPIRFKSEILSSYFPIKWVRWQLPDTTFYGDVPFRDYEYKTQGAQKARLTIRNSFGCDADKFLNFNYQPIPDDVNLLATPIKGCLNTNVVFKSTPILPDSLFQLKWTFGDVGSSTLPNPTHVYAQAGNYPVTMSLRNRNGCEKTFSLRNGISIYPKPTADFDYNPKTIHTATGDVQFKNASSTDVTRWIWQFGSKGGSVLENPTHLFRDTGNVTVRLWVKTPYGCSDSIAKTVYIEPFVSYALPNAFTPNYDGHNDIFKGIGYATSSFKTFSMQIYNRWGEVVFQTDSADEGWNGRKYNTGEMMPEGIYLYVVRYQSFTGKETILNNYITLIR